MVQGLYRGMDSSSLPHIGVLMEKTDIHLYPRYALPDGYHFSAYRPDLDEAWASLQYAVGQTDTLQEAREIFADEFARYPDMLRQRMLFVLKENGELVGSCAIWLGYHFGRELQRVHWVAVAPAQQGRGIAKAMLTHLLDGYQQLHPNGYLYLTTQTWSYPAIGLYLQFGFRPYLGKKPVNWRAVNLLSGEPWDYQTKTQEAWRMIGEKLMDRRSDKEKK